MANPLYKKSIYQKKSSGVFHKKCIQVPISIDFPFVGFKEIDNEESLYSPPSTMIDRKDIRLCMLKW
jgi:hypothetical protein